MEPVRKFQAESPPGKPSKIVFGKSEHEGRGKWEGERTAGLISSSTRLGIFHIIGVHNASLESIQPSFLNTYIYISYVRIYIVDIVDIT